MSAKTEELDAEDAPPGDVPDQTDVDDTSGDAATDDAPITTSIFGRKRPLDGSKRLPSWFPAALIAAAVVMVGALVVWQWRYDSDLAGERSERKSAETAASSFAEKLLTYDYKDLTATKDGLAPLMTDTYKQKFADAFAIGLEPQITKLQATSVAHVKDVYLTEIADGKAKAIVVVDADGSSTAGTRTLRGTYMELDLVKTNGRYLVDELKTIATDSADLTPAGATGTTTPTSTPTSTPAGDSTTSVPAG
jgi:Mce-associated membrane protein